MHFLLVFFFLLLLAIWMVGPGVKNQDESTKSVFLYGYGIGKWRQCMIDGTHRHGLQYIVSLIFIGGVSKGKCRMTFSFYFCLYFIYPVVSMIFFFLCIMIATTSEYFYSVSNAKRQLYTHYNLSVSNDYTYSYR